MASPISHVVVAVALGSALKLPKAPLRLWLLGAACAVVPDVDVLGFWASVPYDAWYGHRGLTHSLAFAGVVSLLIVATAFRGERWASHQHRLLAYFFTATASHAVLDAMTNGGLGVAFFLPFDTTRYFFPFRPIEVSPLSVPAFFTARGLEILWNELVWICLPALLLAVLILFARQRRAIGNSAATS